MPATVRLSKREKANKQREREARRREAALNEPRKKFRPKFEPLKPRSYLMQREDAYSKLPSGPSQQAAIPAKAATVKPKDRADWEQRERLAKEESDRRKKMVAPAYNKGAYQYIGDAPPEVVQTMGRKI